MRREIGLRLRAERVRLGLNQTAMAERGGVELNSQSAFETGKRLPSTEYLLRLAESGSNVGFVLTGIAAADSLSEDEAQLLHAYRTIHPLCRGSLLVIARQLNSEDTPDTARAILRAGLEG